MPVATTWSVVNMTRTTSDGGVFKAQCRVIAQNDSGPENAQIDVTGRFTPNPSSPDYTPYDQLTEAQVIGWVQDQMNANANPTVAELEADLVAKVDARILENSTESSGVPWTITDAE